MFFGAIYCQYRGLYDRPFAWYSWRWIEPFRCSLQGGIPLRQRIFSLTLGLTGFLAFRTLSITGSLGTALCYLGGHALAIYLFHAHPITYSGYFERMFRAGSLQFPTPLHGYVWFLMDILSLCIMAWITDSARESGFTFVENAGRWTMQNLLSISGKVREQIRGSEPPHDEI
jgi:hypothetical protein